MKIGKTLFIVSVLVCAYSLALALPPGHVSSGMNAAKPSKTMILDTRTIININNLQMFCTNIGGFAEDFGGVLETAKADGLYFPAGTDRTVLYSGGVWVGGKVGGEIRTAIGAFDAPEYWPGPANDDGGMLPDDASYKVYKINRNADFWNNPVKTGINMADGTPYLRFDSAQHVDDYDEWPEADGAPLDGDGNPLQLGDQMLWAVFNDGGTHTYDGYGGATDSLGVEVQATYWGYDLPGALGNTIFMKFMFINKSPDVIDSCYVSLWADPDLGGASDDLVGCDTTRSLGFCYNATNSDNVYGGTPPAVGYDFMQGPIIRESDNDPLYATHDFSVDTAFLNTGDTIPQAFIMGMTSFNKYINGTDPDEPEESYGYMKGNDSKSGSGGDVDNPPVNPQTGLSTRFYHPGDPYLGTGWLDDTPADRRYMVNTGPFTFNPDDTQIVVGAVVVGQGADRKTSVLVLKAYDDLAQFAYDQNFDIPLPPPQPEVTAAALDRMVVLTWTDKSETEYVSSTHFFEGYVVYQGETVAGPWKEVAVFDIDNGEALLFDDVIDPAFGVPVFQPVVTGTDAGVQRHIEIEEDYILGGPLHNGRNYYFAVTAYSYPVGNVEAVPKGLRVLNGRPSAITMVPQDILAGTHLSFEATDTIAVIHVGPSDGQVLPLVLDPFALNGDELSVVFSEDLVLGSVWHLLNETDGDTVFANQTNLTGDEDYLISDGLIIKVLGPDPGVKASDMFETDDESLWGWDIPEGTRRFTWAQADGFGWEGFRGALGWGGPNESMHGWGPNDPVPAQSLPDVLLVLASVTVDGTFDTNDTNVSYAYRYGRGFTGAPAQPGFAPFMVNTVDPGYSFQDFEKSCPLSAWNVDVDPPTRLAVGYLENNAALATLDGKYFPAESDSLAAWGTTNTDGGGPREWLWIYLDDYSETSNPAYEGDATSVAMPIMYWLTVARRGSDVPFSPDATGQDQFLIKPGKVNSASDTFTFTATASTSTTDAVDLDNIRVVPNPYYAYSVYETDQFDRQVRFLGLPDEFTIRIFNVAGDMVRILKWDDPSVHTVGNSWAKWNLLTDLGDPDNPGYPGLPVASGIYIWYLESDGFGSKYGKFAIIQEVEQLIVY